MSRKRIIWEITAILTLVVLLAAGCGQNTATTPTAAVPTALLINTTSLPDADVGIAYSRSVAVSGGSGGYIWSVSEGSLPTGFSLAVKTGSISGMPLTPGTSKFTIQVTDSSGKTATQSFSITIAGAPVALSIRTSSLPNGELAINYSQPFQVAGGKSPYTWSISGGALPDGVSLDAGSGTISGTPSKTGKFFFSPQVRDSSGTIATTALTVTINPALSIVSDKLDAAEVGNAYSFSLQAADGVQNYVWSIAKGALPDGLTLDSGSGNISGQPKTAGKVDFTVQVNDAGGAVISQALSITVHEAIALTTSVLPAGKVGAAYSQTLQFTGGNGEVIWAKAGGDLPDGVDFDGNTGTLSGTPKTAGTFKVTFEVIDSFGASSLKELAITVNPA